MTDDKYHKSKGSNNETLQFIWPTQLSLGFLHVQEVLGRESTEFAFPYNNKCLVIKATIQDNALDTLGRKTYPLCFASNIDLGVALPLPLEAIDLSDEDSQEIGKQYESNWSWTWPWHIYPPILSPRRASYEIPQTSYSLFPSVNFMSGYILFDQHTLRQC